MKPQYLNLILYLRLPPSKSQFILSTLTESIYLEDQTRLAAFLARDQNQPSVPNADVRVSVNPSKSHIANASKLQRHPTVRGCSPQALYNKFKEAYPQYECNFNQFQTGCAVARYYQTSNELGRFPESNHVVYSVSNGRLAASFGLYSWLTASIGSLVVRWLSHCQLAVPIRQVQLAEPLVEPLTQFWRVLYLTETLLIYNNSSLKPDSM